MTDEQQQAGLNDRNTFTVDCSQMLSRDAVYDVLFEAIPLPSWCGRNLDALADALWELLPCDIVMLHAEKLSAHGPLGNYGVQLKGVLLEVALQRGADLDITFKLNEEE